MSLSPPLNLTTDYHETYYIDVKWDPPSSGDVPTDYNLRYRQQGTTEWAINSYTAWYPTETQYGWFDALPGMTYECQVQSANDAGDTSAWTESYFDTSLSDTLLGTAGIGQVWITNTYMDFRNPAIRGKFVNPNGTWKDVGLYGQGPTGEYPMVFLRVGPDESPDDFPDNWGDGGSWYSNWWGNDPTTGEEYPWDMLYDQCVPPPVPPTTVETLILTDLEVTELVRVEDRNISLRYSHDAGASWSHPLQQTIGAEGAYETEVSFRRLGMGRSTVFEIGWSCAQATAITGIQILYELGET